MGDDEALSHLIGEIYDAALDPAKWPSALAKSAVFVGGQAAGLLSKNPVSQLGNAHFHVGVEAEYIKLYEEKYWKFDPLVPLFFYDVGEVTSRLDYVADAEFLEGRFHREWAKPQGWVDSASVILKNRPRISRSSASCAAKHRGWWTTRCADASASSSPTCGEPC